MVYSVSMHKEGYQAIKKHSTADGSTVWTFSADDVEGHLLLLPPASLEFHTVPSTSHGAHFSLSTPSFGAVFGAWPQPSGEAKKKTMSQV